ncbi:MULTISPECIES: extensin family protein [unclassified Sphingomonas]|uniref:extensin-like domain-containing protein n=1 Tax=unclassified Sphingomonas TaxID=196159 RepID=UPI0021517900|nr:MULTISPECIES: extensin family protein [unclassified Sphingomonas]MCR5871332.1 extensin family protein [Sphingomonas sp. J344]UUY00363.1 extensin family protein [Sphingomonas sp. J315]
MKALRTTIGAIVIAALLLTLALLVYAMLRNRPQDLPWTKLDLSQPVGLFTGRKITGLTDDFPACRAALDKAGIRYTALPARDEGEGCGYTDAVRFTKGGARRIGFAPSDLGVSCPVAAGLAVWEWEVVQPAAQRIFGQRVAEIEHFGSYNCRRMYNREGASWSEHATADAVDIAAFRLADGTRITLIGDWAGEGEKAQFLRAVRDGGCDLFATVLSPDYNEAHRDHFHFDQAERGAMGWRACR